VLPVRSAGDLGFRRVVVAGAYVDGPAIHRVRLTGRDTVVVIPDESESRGRYQSHLGAATECARVDIPDPSSGYRYRLLASIVIAEAARQAGFGPAGRPRVPARPGLSYESALRRVADGAAEEVGPSDLDAY
jgi:hypothetical protein